MSRLIEKIADIADKLRDASRLNRATASFGDAFIIDTEKELLADLADMVLRQQEMIVELKERVLACESK